MIKLYRESCLHSGLKLRGFTLTEAAIVLGVAGLVLGAIWATLPNIYASMRANQLAKVIAQAEQIDAQMTKTDYLRNTAPFVSTTSLDALVAAGAFPGDFIANRQGDVITTAQGYQLRVLHNMANVSVAGGLFANDVTFQFEIPRAQSMASAQCVQLVRKVIALPRASGIYFTNGATNAYYGRVLGFNAQSIGDLFSGLGLTAEMLEALGINFSGFGSNMSLATLSRRCTLASTGTAGLTVAIGFDRTPGIVP